MGLEPGSVRLSVLASACAFTLSNMNISETSWPIIIKFHLEHHWGGGWATLGFGPDRIRTLVSLATSFLIGSSLSLQVMRTTITSWMGSKFGTGTYELAV